MFQHQNNGKRLRITQHVNRIPRSRLPNSLTNYAPRGIRSQGRPLKRFLDERDRKRPAMAYFPESEMMMMMMMMIMTFKNYIRPTIYHAFT
jgi:hypothetical protein